MSVSVIILAAALPVFDWATNSIAQRIAGVDPAVCLSRFDDYPPSKGKLGFPRCLWEKPFPANEKFWLKDVDFSPAQRARLDAEVEDMNREYVLSQIRAEMGLTQCDMAERLSVSQPAYAAYEKADNMRIGTLQKIVAALGGALSFHVEINGRDYSLQMPKQMAMA